MLEHLSFANALRYWQHFPISHLNLALNITVFLNLAQINLSTEVVYTLELYYLIFGIIYI